MTVSADAHTFVFISGAWMTPACWSAIADSVAANGHQVVLAPWPGKDRPITEIRRDPSPMAGLGLGEIADHYERLVRNMPDPPVLVGHSFGGLVVQLLLDRGVGAAGVAIDPAPPRGVLTWQPSALRSIWHVLADPLHPRRVVGLSYRQFRYAFAHRLSDEEARAAHARHVVPDTARIFFQAVLAPLQPRSPARIDFANAARPPLLLIAGERDRIVPAATVRATYRRYRRSAARTDYTLLHGRTHWILAEPGWREVARRVEQWAERHTSENPGAQLPSGEPEVRVVTYNTAAGNPRIKTAQADFLTLPFYRDALTGAPTAPLLALQEVGPAQARALRRAAQTGHCRLVQIRRPGLGNALVIPDRYQVLARRRRYYAASQLRGIGDAVWRYALRRSGRPNWRQFGELRGYLEVDLRDRRSGRRFTLLTTHLSIDPSLKVAQARVVARRTRAAASRGPVILAGDLNVRKRRPRGRDLEVAALLAAFHDAGTVEPRGRPDIDYILVAGGFEGVRSRIWEGESLSLPGCPTAKEISDHYPEDDVVRFATAASARPTDASSGRQAA